MRSPLLLRIEKKREKISYFGVVVGGIAKMIISLVFVGQDA